MDALLLPRAVGRRDVCSSAADRGDRDTTEHLRNHIRKLTSKHLDWESGSLVMVLSVENEMHNDGRDQEWYCKSLFSSR